MPAELLLGLFEQLLIALEDATLLAVRLEQLVQVLAQPSLNRDGLFERQGRRARFGRDRRLDRRCFRSGRGNRRHRFFRGLRPPGQPLRHG